jgi:hypothetical protein
MMGLFHGELTNEVALLLTVKITEAVMEGAGICWRRNAPADEATKGRPLCW